MNVKTSKSKMSARFWTRKECGVTLGQCKRAGFQVESNDGMVKIYDNENLVVSWVTGGAGQHNMVRVDLNYFN